MPARLEKQFTDLWSEIAELKRRFRNKERRGKVVEVDYAKGLARVELSKEDDGTAFKTAWIPWTEIAMGDIKTHFPPAIGQQVTVRSESGDLTDAIIDQSIPSDQNPRTHDQGAEPVIDVGDSRFHMKGDKVVITTPHAVILSDKVELGGEGGPKVARIGDRVNVTYGSSAGLHPIVEGSSKVFAVD